MFSINFFFFIIYIILIIALLFAITYSIYIYIFKKRDLSVSRILCIVLYAFLLIMSIYNAFNYFTKL